MARLGSLVAGAVLGIMLMVTAGCISGNELQVHEHHIDVQEYTGDTTQSSATVSGVAVNTGRWTIRDGKVVVSFYDYKGNVLGILSDNKSLLGPGESWDFKVELKGRDAWNVARYEITTSNK